jgi:tetratricopeptide (TPR) repeat protein
MNWLPVFSAAALACASLLAACASADQRAARAAEEAQIALQMGNMAAARDALQRAVQAKDDVAGYWLELGRAYVALQQFGDAYFAYARAVELDRTNAEALQTLAEIALASGRVNEAEDFVEQLEVLQPGNLGSVLNRGFIAVRRRDYNGAISRADTVLAAVPTNQNAIILKARALVGKGLEDEGTQLLERHLQTRASDKAVLQALLNLYRYMEDRQGLARTAERLLVHEPDNVELKMTLVRELYALGRRESARSAAMTLAKSPPSANVLADILSLWLTYESRSRSLADVRSLAGSSGPSARLLYAQFMLEAGAAREAAALLEEAAKPPVTSGNADRVAVFGRALHAGGAAGRGRELLDAVLEFDPTNILALRARADIALAEEDYDQALTHASRAVAEAPKSAQDRLRLARYYEQKGEPRLAEKVYWEAFQDVPGNGLIYKALREFLIRSGRRDSIAALERQFETQTRLAKAQALAA